MSRRHRSGLFPLGGVQAASLRGWSPSQGDGYDHVVLVPTSGCGEEIGNAEGKKTGTEIQTHLNNNTHIFS
ncbi:hypothetical protein ATANTOWER_000004 [Ataeniobius toweri]|uniref:Uncharacterized protein n=1 Tax=Ataeniobius toweri TaxID=208326 RepID=A0ABU7A113_9TELE|nr:hypothetical protein [Ataeniobius toweri]